MFFVSADFTFQMELLQGKSSGSVFAACIIFYLLKSFCTSEIPLVKACKCMNVPGYTSCLLFLQRNATMPWLKGHVSASLVSVFCRERTGYKGARYQAGHSDDVPSEIYPRSRVKSSAGPAEHPVGHFLRPTSGVCWSVQQCMDPPKQLFKELCDGAGMKNWPLDFKPWLCF